MAIVWDGMPCAICNQPIDTKGDFFASTALTDPETGRMLPLSDGAMHRRCLYRYRDFEKFVRAYHCWRENWGDEIVYATPLAALHLDSVNDELTLSLTGTGFVWCMKRHAWPGVMDGDRFAEALAAVPEPYISRIREELAKLRAAVPAVRKPLAAAFSEWIMERADPIEKRFPRFHGVTWRVAALMAMPLYVLRLLLLHIRRKCPQERVLVRNSYSDRRENSETRKNRSERNTQKAAELQKAYWQFDPEEKRKLLDLGIGNLPWERKLRLLHLACLELCGTPPVQQQIKSDTIADEGARSGVACDLCAELIRDLTGPGSPYRARCCAVWQKESITGIGERKAQPDLMGTVLNASMTHLGALEVIRLDENLDPRELAFVGLHELQAFVVAPGTPFCLGRLFHEDGGPENVWIPSFYGISWSTPHEFDRDGSLTRFVAHLANEDGSPQRCIGLGLQDLIVSSAEKSDIVALNSIREFSMPLDMRESDFDRKCHLRGLDPDEMRKAIQ